MSIESFQSREIIIAGSGISAAAVALRLISLGFRPKILSLGRAILPGTEAIPEAAFSLIVELGLERAVMEAGGKTVEGFENAWTPSTPVLRPGRWLHVDRRAFASEAISEALARGTAISKVKTLPPAPTGYLAVVDATGRSAAWSRPIRRRGNQVADLFEIPIAAERGRIERLPDGWRYRIGHTLGIVAALRRRPAVPSESRYIGRRPAFPQWCENPVENRRIAVGDAAFAYNPVAGQGIRFALASAFAAASVIRTWSETGDLEAAGLFYRNFVEQARIRHLEFLTKLDRDQAPEPVRALPDVVRFSGRRVPAGLSFNSRIVAGEAVLLEDGTAARWVGGIDLLDIEKLARKSIDTAALLSQLRVDSNRARAVLAWCLRRGILAGAAKQHNTTNGLGVKP